MKRVLVLICVLAVASMCAWADPLTIVVGAAPGGTMPVPLGPVSNNPTLPNHYSAGGVTYDGNFAFVAGSVPNVYLSPFFPDATIPYVTVPISGSFSPLSYTLTFDTDQTYFGLLWGSIDTYNSMTFLENGTPVAFIDGTQAGILAGVPANGDANSKAFFNFFSSTAFNQIQFTSTNFAFETAALTEAPEPGTMALFGSGLATFAAFLRRRMKA
jgi:PEP-CTERM motif